MKVVSSAKLSEKHQKNLRERFTNVEFHFFDSMEQVEQELEIMRSMDILITYGEDVTEKTLQYTPALKWIQVISAGINELPFLSLKEKGITVTNAKGIHGVPMAEYTMSVILQVARKTNELYLQQNKNTWDRTIRVNEIYGSTLGVIGLGAIGQAIVERAKAFGMNVIGINSNGRPIPNVDNVYKIDELDNLLSKSDYVVIIVPLTESTHHLISEKQLNVMKDTAYLINIARGEVVDEAALLNALDNKKIAGAVLDVFSQEPLPEEHPFWKLDNCIITPHLSGRSPFYMKRALDIFYQNTELYLNGNYNEMVNLIDLDKGY